jgi:Flp pilus assembly protein TadG
MRGCQNILCEEQGSNLVEFAIASLIFLTALLGILYFSLALYADHFVTDAADAAARYAIVRGSTWNGVTCQSASTYQCAATSTDVSNYVLNNLPPAILPANLAVSTTWPGTTTTGGACDTESGANSPNCEVVVQVSYSLNLPLPLLNLQLLPLTSTSSMTIAR